MCIVITCFPFRVLLLVLLISDMSGPYCKGKMYDHMLIGIAQRISKDVSRGNNRLTSDRTFLVHGP